MEAQQIIDRFIAHLRACGHGGLVLQRRPDDENRETSDIDAIAGPFAIEHTSVDTLPNQRRDADWFMRAAGGLEAELPADFPCRLNITLKYDAVDKGQDWSLIRHSLRSWILARGPDLPEGQTIERIPGVPFEVHVVKSAARRHGVRFGRFSTDDDSLPLRIRRLLDRKAEKLAPYRANGFTTVLLVENDDIALMDDWKMFDAIQKAYPKSGKPAGIDRLWFVDSSGDLRFRDFTEGFSTPSR